uniref:Chromosome 11 open reading frame 52 n=1 Tax=Taeniopygia guttata TaxID=59729 RepID=A0A674H9D3_TAEGU
MKDSEGRARSGPSKRVCDSRASSGRWHTGLRNPTLAATPRAARNQETPAEPVQRALGLPGEGAPWATCAGADVRHEAQQQQPGRKVPTYEDVPDVPIYATVSKARAVQQDENIHYADIQVFSKARERSAAEVKNLQLQNATEYATLNFPRARLKYDSKNGTLV